MLCQTAIEGTVNNQHRSNSQPSRRHTLTVVSSATFRRETVAGITKGLLGVFSS